MARNVTLLEVLNSFRAEIRASLNPAHNQQVREQHIHLLQRVQTRLWDEFDWPALRVERIIPLQAGQRFYSPPEDVKIDRIRVLEVRQNGYYLPLSMGLEACHYGLYDSERDVRAWPVQRWRIAEAPDRSVEQIEVWPIPDRAPDPVTLDGNLRVTGTRNLRRFVDDADRADLDDRLITLYAAAEVLAATGAKDAQFKFDMAKRLDMKLRGAQLTSRPTSMFVGRTDAETPRRPVAIYRAP